MKKIITNLLLFFAITLSALYISTSCTSDADKVALARETKIRSSLETAAVGACLSAKYRARDLAKQVTSYPITDYPDDAYATALEMSLWMHPICGDRALPIKSKMTDAILAHDAKQLGEALKAFSEL